MKKRVAAFICALVASSAYADTYSLTNGVTINGTVVSGIVAQVVMRMANGSTRSIPVAEFDKTERSRLPQDAAGIYVCYSEVRRICEESFENADVLMERCSGLVERSNSLTERLNELNEKFKQTSENEIALRNQLNKALDIQGRVLDYVKEASAKRKLPPSVISALCDCLNPPQSKP